MKLPRVGIGVILINKEEKILIGKRCGSHACKYSISSGHLDVGETFEQAAKKEIKEETDLDIRFPKVIAVTNNLDTYKEEGLHYISIALLVKKYSGKLKIMEPSKCEEWLWVNPRKLPQPHFDASYLAVQCYLESKFYIQ